MRLFHVSEESDITIFKPRIPDRNDLDKTKGLVWAITEECLPNFLTPRDCPRVTYHQSISNTREDITRFFSSSSRHCIAIEYGWYEKMKTPSYIFMNLVLQIFIFKIRLQDIMLAKKLRSQSLLLNATTYLWNTLTEMLKLGY